MSKPRRESVNLETKAMPILSKEIGEDRVVKSLFAVMGHIDSYGDRIQPGAFSKTLGENLDRVRVLWQHEYWTPPVGVPLVLKEIGRDEMPDMVLERFPDATGALYGEVRYLDTPRGSEILSGIRAGAVKENSIGFDTIKGDDEEIDRLRVRNLRELRLWDLSPVNWGAQPAALNLNVKHFTGLDRFAAVFPKEQCQLLNDLVELTERALEPEFLQAERVLSDSRLAQAESALDQLSEVLLIAEPPEDEAELQALTENLKFRLSVYQRHLSELGV